MSCRAATVARMIREPFLETQGIHNFRDFGGWLGADGRQVRTGLLYRSGQHVEASDADLAAIDALDIRTVIDLRGEGERARNPCRRVEGWDGDVLFYEGETSSSPPHMDIGPDTSAADFARERMLAVYTRMPDNPAMIDMFGRYLTILAQREGASLVHCYAGKDRTGVAATMLLHILRHTKKTKGALCIVRCALPLPLCCVLGCCQQPTNSPASGASRRAGQIGAVNAPTWRAAQARQQGTPARMPTRITVRYLGSEVGKKVARPDTKGGLLELAAKRLNLSTPASRRAARSASIVRG